MTQSNNEPARSPSRPGLGGPHRAFTLHRLLKAKTVAFFPGVCLLINAMTGPSIPFTPSLFQEGGYIPIILMFLFFAIVSTFCCLFIVEAMQAIPGNKYFQGTVEFATLINFYFGDVPHIIGQVCLYGAIESNAIQSIVIASQSIDNLLIDIFGKTCGLALQGPKVFLCVGEKLASPSPFGSTFMFFTLGFLLTLILCIPLGLVPLDDNINVQVFAWGFSILIIFQWILASLLYLTSTSAKVASAVSPGVPIWGTNVGGLAGTVMLSLAFCFVVPSWVNLKKKDVNVQHTMWTSSIGSSLLYLVIGIFPAISLPISGSGNVLPSLSTFGIPAILTKITTYLFALVMLLPSIPVSFIVAKDNLFQNGVVGNKTATFLTFILPWLISIPFLTGESLFEFQKWTSLLFVSTANFIVPVVIYLKCLDFRKNYNVNRAILTDKQRRLLKSIHSSSQTIKDWVDLARPQSKPAASTEPLTKDPISMNAIPSLITDEASPVASSSTKALGSKKQESSPDRDIHIRKSFQRQDSESHIKVPTLGRISNEERQHLTTPTSVVSSDKSLSRSQTSLPRSQLSFMEDEGVVDTRRLSIRRGNTARFRKTEKDSKPLPSLLKVSLLRTTSSTAALLQQESQNELMDEPEVPSDNMQHASAITLQQPLIPTTEEDTEILNEERYLLEDVPDPLAEDEELIRMRKQSISLHDGSSSMKSGTLDRNTVGRRMSRVGTILKRAVTTTWAGKRQDNASSERLPMNVLREHSSHEFQRYPHDSNAISESTDSRHEVRGRNLSLSVPVLDSRNRGVSSERRSLNRSPSPQPPTAGTSSSASSRQGAGSDRDSLMLQPTPLFLDRMNTHLFRTQTLPMHPEYKASRAFRSLPRFVTVDLGISPRIIGIVFLVLTSLVAVLSIGFEIHSALYGK